MKEVPSYFRYWGKACPAGNGEADWHRLVYHNLDVAAVGKQLLIMRPSLLKQLSSMTSIPEDRVLPWFTFLFSIHDIGKFSYIFQRQCLKLHQTLHGSEAAGKILNHEHHTVLGFEFCHTYIVQFLSENEVIPEGKEDNIRDLIIPWVSAVTGHHGRPPKNIVHSQFVDNCFPNHINKDIFAFISELVKLFLQEGIPFSGENYDDYVKYLKYFSRSSWLIAGLTVIADWIASNREFWSKNNEIVPLNIYWEKSLERASDVLRDIQLGAPEISSYSGIENIFPKIKNPSPLQMIAQEINISGNQHLFIIEEVTGGGKTEAAIVLAHRLMDEGLAEGLYLGMPTMATANAMYDRVKEIVNGRLKVYHFRS